MTTQERGEWVNWWDRDLSTALSSLHYACEHGQTCGPDLVQQMGASKVAMWEQIGLTHLAPNVTQSNWVVLLACVLIAGAHADAYGCSCAQEAPPAELLSGRLVQQIDPADWLANWAGVPRSSLESRGEDA